MSVFVGAAVPEGWLAPEDDAPRLTSRETAGESEMAEIGSTQNVGGRIKYVRGGSSEERYGWVLNQVGFELRGIDAEEEMRRWWARRSSHILGGVFTALGEHWRPSVINVCKQKQTKMPQLDEDGDLPS